MHDISETNKKRTKEGKHTQHSVSQSMAHAGFYLEKSWATKKKTKKILGGKIIVNNNKMPKYVTSLEFQTKT